MASRRIIASVIAVFMLAAATDWLDGYLARKYGLITTLGRILDPFADKIVVCGTFILLAAILETPGLSDRLLQVLKGHAI